MLLLLIYWVSDAVASEVQTPSWQLRHAQLQHLTDSIFNRLEEIQSVLVRRVRNKDPALLARLSLEPLEPRAKGYGLLPEIKDNAPLAVVSPKQTIYSLKWLENRLNEELKKSQSLFDQLALTPDLDSLVSRFEDILKQLRHLEKHLSYQEQWQKSVANSPEYFRQKNLLIAQVREIEALRRNNDSEALIDELSQQLRQKMVSFTPTPDLAMIITEAGKRVLPVTVCTDIDDKEFLQIFKQGVDDAFNQSLAARAHRFSVELSWRVMAAETLYPDGAPDKGEKINVKVHLSLFKDCPLILTTGASSTNARLGNRIVLGTDPESRRILAHEFGHLLGFEDAYLRGYRGDPDSIYGIEIVEWTGLMDDLMGSPAYGKVSDAMIETLLTAYGGQGNKVNSVLATD